MNYFLCKLLTVGLLIYVTCMQEVSGLRCYTCTNCEKEDVSQKDCGSAGDTCLKMDLGDVVVKSCIRSEMCTLQGVENKVKSLWNTITSAKVYATEDHIHCCYTDYCNSGSAYSLSIGILVFGAAVAWLG